MAARVEVAVGQQRRVLMNCCGRDVRCKRLNKQRDIAGRLCCDKLK